MPAFLVEVYVPRAKADSVEDGARQARRSAQRLSRGGTPVRFVQSIFIPEDEICFFLYQAESADVVRQAAMQTALVVERVTEVRLDGAPHVPIDRSGTADPLDAGKQ